MIGATFSLQKQEDRAVALNPALDRRPRFPAEIIRHAVWRYVRFTLSHRDVEEVLAERGIQVSDAAIRRWWRQVGPADADQLRRRRLGPADPWHVAAMPLKLRGKQSWLWRAVAQDGCVLAIRVQQRRHEPATVGFLRRIRAAAGGAPRVIVTDQLASSGPAVTRALPTTEPRRHTRLNNRAENSQVSVRTRERVLPRVKSAQHAPRFLEPFSAVCNPFRPRRHRLSAHHDRDSMRDRFRTWQQLVGMAPHP